MTDDLVTRLRRYPYDFTEEAANRIEQLEAALRTMVKARENKPENCSDEYLVWCCIDTARAALAGKKKDD
jgi:hypothetical protein